jgi:hypothetical protein
MSWINRSVTEWLRQAPALFEGEGPSQSDNFNAERISNDCVRAAYKNGTAADTVHHMLTAGTLVSWLPVTAISRPKIESHPGRANAEGAAGQFF